MAFLTFLVFSCLFLVPLLIFRLDLFSLSLLGKRLFLGVASQILLASSR